jgi:phage baseplate assembly protein W
VKYLGSDIGLNSEGELAVENGDIGIVAGLDGLSGNLLDRVFSGIGELIMHPDFGAGLMDKVSLPLSQDRIDDTVVTVKHELLKDPRVAEVTYINGTAEGRMFYVSAGIKTVTGQVIGNLVFPFELEMA